MNKTGIEWCTRTWNPITGCFHGCPYCYARNQTRRFAFRIDPDPGHGWGDSQRSGKECDCGKIHDLMGKGISPYPYGFDPTFHRYRLGEPQGEKKPQNVFVGSMADVFGDWLSDNWIGEVFKACEDAPQHRYLFLTKNPKRYERLEAENRLPIGRTHFYGTTATKPSDPVFTSNYVNTFVSIEPIMDNWNRASFEGIDWIIVGAETGNRKNKVKPPLEWIENVVTIARSQGKPVFMKNSLAGIWPHPLIQEYPWTATARR